MALPLGEDGDEHVRARHLLTAGGLDVNDRALDDALEAGCGLGVFVPVDDEVVELGVDIIGQVAAQAVEVDVAGAHDGGCVLVVHEGEEEMLERRVFLAAFVGGGERLVQRLF